MHSQHKNSNALTHGSLMVDNWRIRPVVGWFSLVGSVFRVSISTLTLTAGFSLMEGHLDHNKSVPLTPKILFQMRAEEENWGTSYPTWKTAVKNGGGSGCGDGCWSSMIRNLAITHRWCISSSGKMLHKRARHSLLPLAWQCSTSRI